MFRSRKHNGLELFVHAEVWTKKFKSKVFQVFELEFNTLKAELLFVLLN